MQGKRKIVLWLLLLALTVCGGEPRVEALIRSRQVSLQETFIYQLKIISDNDEDVKTPVFPATDDFQVSGPRGPNRSTNTSMTIVNGKTTSTRTEVYTYTYHLRPRRQGDLQIPPVSVQVGKKTLRSQPITIKVVKEAKNLLGNLSLTGKLSSSSCYVGEAVMLEWEWFFDQNVYGYSVDLPVLVQEDFAFPNFIPDYVNDAVKSGGNQVMELDNEQDKQIFARKQIVNKGGIRGQSITFSQPLIPIKPGRFVLPPASIQMKVEDTRDQRQPQRRSPFDDFDDFFGRPRSTRLLTIAAEPLTLEVKELPEAGRPDNFSGIVGACEVTVTAKPLEVSVGEPILLNIAVSGPKFLDTLRLPDFSRQESLSGKFKLSGDEPGVITNGAMVFQRTLRAMSADCTEIPPLEIAFFNSMTGKYEVAKSAAIPLQVTAVRNLSLSDAQGAPLSASDAIGGREVRQALTGLVHNYAPEELLESQSLPEEWWKSPAVRLCLVLPPLLWLLLGAGLWLYRRLYGNPQAVARRQAVPNCLGKLKKLRGNPEATPEQLSQILQEFFADTYGLQAGTITFADLQDISSKHGEAPDKWQAFQEIFAACEEARFAGRMSSVPILELIDKTRKALERS